MKKVLIWDDFRMSNIGGPMGYCYNIHEYLKAHPNDQITFLSDLLGEKFDDSSNKHVKKEKNKLCDFFYTIFTFLFCHYRYGCKKLPAHINLNEFDYIHFHLTNSAAKFIHAHKEYKGKTILTSHTPCPRTVEVFAGQSKWKKMFWNLEIGREAQTYSKVDYIMFPCKEAREPYEKYPIMKKTFTENEQKFFYNPSSIMDLKVNTETFQKYEEFGIPNDAFVITYFGRHTDVKGYDILKEIGKQLLNKYTNLYFLCAGRGEIAPIDHPRWIELGFINNANELLSQSSLYILPNKDTYFDLVTLEILRAGIPVILSETGGNKYFQHFKKEELCGMFFFKLNDMSKLLYLVESIIRLKKDNPQEYENLKTKNRQLFLEYFTINKFVERYQVLVENLN